MDKKLFNFQLSEQHRQILEVALKSRINKKKRAFLRRKMNHVNDPRLKKVYENLTTDFCEILYEIPFQCYFSFYLFLILKDKLQFISRCNKLYEAKYAIAQDFNILKLSKETGVCRNIIRRAFDELVAFRMIEETTLPPSGHKSTKTVILFNDNFINYFDEEQGQVVYTAILPFNHYIGI